MIAGIKETRFWCSRPRLRWFESQCRDRDWISLSLNVKTETETEFPQVLMSKPRPRLKDSESQFQDWDWIFSSLIIETKTETYFLKVSMSRMRWRPKININILNFVSKIFYFLGLKLNISWISWIISAIPKVLFNYNAIWFILQV